jgi:alpha-ketoglutarate-dependent taurine dioxygenase
MRNGKLKESNFKRFMTARPVIASPQNEPLTKAYHFQGEARFPLVIEPAVADLDLSLWAGSNLDFLEAELLRHGAILFRNFKVRSIDDFNLFTKVFSAGLMEYTEPSTPRGEVAQKIYNSSEYPSNQFIPLHNEMSYAHRWPMKIWFYCDQPAQQGGETPIADSRKVFSLLDPKVKARFMQERVMYVRNFGDGVGLAWQTVFNSTKAEEVEESCNRMGIQFEWRQGKRLRLRYVRQAFTTHPKTGETVWFNQAHLHHHMSLPRALRESLLETVEDKEYPLDINARYGDDSPIGADELNSIHEAYKQSSVRFPWQQGDILMVDNMLIAHGRTPFIGPRRILLAMAEPHSSGQDHLL